MKSLIPPTWQFTDEDIKQVSMTLQIASITMNASDKASAFKIRILPTYIYEKMETLHLEIGKHVFSS